MPKKGSQPKARKLKAPANNINNIGITKRLEIMEIGVIILK